jgi:hypothetical protein
MCAINKDKSPKPTKIPPIVFLIVNVSSSSSPGRLFRRVLHRASGASGRASEAKDATGIVWQTRTASVRLSR